MCVDGKKGERGRKQKVEREGQRQKGESREEEGINRHTHSLQVHPRISEFKGYFLLSGPSQVAKILYG